MLGSRAWNWPFWTVPTLCLVAFTRTLPLSLQNPLGLPRWLSSKEINCQCRRRGFDPWVEKIPWGGHGNPLQYSCLGSPTDREASATVCGVTEELARTEQLNSHLWNPCDGTFCLASWMFHFSPGCRGCP